MVRWSLILFSTLWFLKGCTTLPPIVNSTDLSQVDFSAVKNFRRGESCTTLFLGIIPFGTTRITAAVRDGRIKNLKVTEYENRNFLIFNQFCLIAYGT
jgi:hypothetical protein